MNDIIENNVAALQGELTALAARVAALEGKPQPLTTHEEPFDLYARAIHQNLRQKREENSVPFGMAVVSMMMESSLKGSTGTASSLFTIEKPNDLPDDTRLLAHMARFALLLADPLVLRCLRHFLRLRFDGKPPQATAQELADATQSTPETIDRLLQPLVEDRTLRRGLNVNTVPFYEWEGYDHRILVLLFHD